VRLKKLSSERAARTVTGHGNFFSLRMTGQHESGHNGRFILEVDEDEKGVNYAVVSSSAENLNDGKWHHVAAVRQGQDLLLYADGQPAEITVTAVANIHNGNPFRIGSGGSFVFQRAFAGHLQAADFRVYDTALSATEIRQLAQPRATTIGILSGNNQFQPRVSTSDGVPTATFAPLSVSVQSIGGIPAPGQSVTWTSASHAPMAVQMKPSGETSCVTVADARGVATLNQMGGDSITAIGADGPFTVMAALPGVVGDFGRIVAAGASVTFNLTVGTATITIVNGDGQIQPGSGGIFLPLEVLVRIGGVAAPGQPVTWTAHPGPGVLVAQLEPSPVPPAGESSCITATDGRGIAILDKMNGSSVHAAASFDPSRRSPGVPQMYQFTVTASCLGASATFNLELTFG
jgi:Concanavalin A-like lectin/glucanases superfamily